jgi:hypothetical protein
MSKAIIESKIESNGIGGWWIRLSDTLDGREMICHDMAEFQTNIELIGDNYGGEIVVHWSKDKNVTPEHFHEVELAMHAYKQEMEASTL